VHGKKVYLTEGEGPIYTNNYDEAYKLYFATIVDKCEKHDKPLLDDRVCKEPGCEDCDLKRKKLKYKIKVGECLICKNKYCTFECPVDSDKWKGHLVQCKECKYLTRKC